MGCFNSHQSEVKHQNTQRANDSKQMDVVLLLIMTGLCAVSSHAEHRCYHFVYELKTWTEAQSYCREKYTDLATIDNMEDMKILNNMADERRVVPSAAWIGLYDDVNNWRWSLSDRSFYEHGETGFRRWLSGQPNNIDSGPLCALMDLGGEWGDDPCGRHKKAVCSDVKGQNVTFVLTDTTMTWTEAQSFCREHYTDLASVRNKAENQKINGMGTGNVWIGLFRDSWKWSDGSKSSFTYWKSGEPNRFNEPCAAADFSKSGQWEDWICQYKKMFICYSATFVQVMKVRFERKNSSLDPNDPAVMEAILKELNRKLKDQGVNDTIKLSWAKQSDGNIFHKEEKKTKKKKI